MIYLLIGWWYLAFPAIWLGGSLYVVWKLRCRVILRALAFILALTLWYPIVMWDDILGRWKWRELCASEAGFEIYRTVTLPENMFKSSGYLKLEHSRYHRPEVRDTSG